MTLVTNLDTAVAGWPSGKYSASIASFLRPNNVTPYTAKDVISDSTTAALVFPGCAPSGAIRHVSVTNRLETDVITPRLWIFDAEPTNHADNAGLALVAADIPKIVAFFDFVEADKELIGTLTNYYQANVATAGLGFLTGPVPYTTASGSLYGLLQTVSGYTPAASTQFTIKLGIEHD
jgi:hypothetical protein